MIEFAKLYLVNLSHDGRQETLGQPADKPFRLLGASQRNSHRPATGAIVTNELSFNLIQIFEAETQTVGELIGILVAGMTTHRAGNFEALRLRNVHQLQFGFPAHQKSSTFGIRV